MVVSRCEADENEKHDRKIDASGYFRVDISTVAATGTEEARTRVVVETYELSDLPKMPDLDLYPDIKKEIVSYLKLGFKYVKVEMTLAGAKKSKKVELYRDKGKM